MAKEICNNSNVVASALLMSDERQANAILDLMTESDAYRSIGDSVAQKNTDILLDAYIQASVLSWRQGWEISKRNLINKMANTGDYTKKQLEEKLDDIDKFSDSISNDVEFRERINAFWWWDIDEAIEQYKNYMATENALSEAYTLKDKTVKEHWKKMLEKTKPEKRLSVVVDTSVNDFVDKWIITKSNAKNILLWVENWLNELNKRIKELWDKIKWAKRNWSAAWYTSEMKKLQEQYSILKEYGENLKKRFKIKKTGKSLAEEEQNIVDTIVKESWTITGDIDKRYLKATQKDWLLEALKAHEFNSFDAHYIAMREILWDEKAYNNYVVGRALLSQWDIQASRLLQNLWLYSLWLGKLTKQKISEIGDIEELVSVAFSYWDELAHSNILLNAFLEKKKEIIATALPNKEGKITENVFWTKTQQKVYIEALRDLSLYGDNFKQHISAKLFTSRLQMLWYQIPKWFTDEEIYQKIAFWIVGWKGIEIWDLVLKKEDLENIIPLYAPKWMRYTDTTELIRYAWYWEYRDVLLDSVNRNAVFTSTDSIDEFEKKLFDPEKLEKKITEYKEKLGNANSDNKTQIALKMFTNLTLDTNKVLFIWKWERAFKGNVDQAKDMTNKMMAYDTMAKSNSILVSSNTKGSPSIPCFKDLEELKQAVWWDKVAEYLKQYDYIITDWNSFTAEDLYKFIDNVNQLNGWKKIEMIWQGGGKFMAQWRFYMERWSWKAWEWQLRYSLINDEGMNDFFTHLNEMWINIDLKVWEDLADLKERLGNYINQIYGWENVDDTIKQLEEFLSVFPKRRKQPWKKEITFETDFYELERFINQSLQTTGKYKIDNVNLKDARDKLPKDKDFYKDMAKKRANDLWLDIDENTLWNLDLEEVKTRFFDSVYNNDITKGIEAKYNFLKMFGAIGVANDTDKIMWIAYAFNKELKKQGMNMWIFQIDWFIEKLLKGEDINKIMIDDTRSTTFINSNRWNPNFRWIDNDSQQAFRTLIARIKDTIWFDNLSKRLSFQTDVALKEWEKHIPHDWEQFMFKMIEWNWADKYLEQLRAYWIYMKQWWQKIKLTDETQLLNSIIDMYEADMKNVSSYKEALELKQRVWFVLDTIEQKVIIPKYWDRLPPNLKQNLLGWSYELPIDVDNVNEDYFKEDIKKLRERYNELGDRIKKQVDTYNSKTPQEKMDELLETKSVWVYDENWGAVTITTTDMFEKYQTRLQGLDWTEWYDDWVMNLIHLTKEQFNQLSTDKQIAVITKLAILNKHMDYKSVYSKCYNHLYSWIRDADFFVNYKLDEEWYPQIFKTIKQQWLPWAKSLDQQEVDNLMKNVFDDIMANFFTAWKRAKDSVNIWFDWKFATPTMKDIQELIEWRLKEFVVMEDWKAVQKLNNKEFKQLRDSLKQYFLPYTSMKWLPPEITSIIDEKLFKEFDPFLEVIGITKQDVINNYWDMKLADWKTVEEMLVVWEWEENLANYLRNSNKDKVLLSQLEIWKGKVDVEKDVSIVNEVLNSWCNGYTEIKEIDKALASDWLFGLQWTFNKYTSLNRIYETSEIMAGKWEVAANQLEDLVFGWLSISKLKDAYKTWKTSWQLLWWVRNFVKEFWKQGMQSLRKNTILFNLAWWTTKWFKEWVLDKIKGNYWKYYSMDYNDLMYISPSQITDNEERLALLLAQYFRQLGNELWSYNGLKWITTSTAENIALYNIWDCILNINSATSALSLISALNQWQFFRFFKFINKWDAWYSQFFKMLWDSTDAKAATNIFTQQWLLLHNWIDTQGVQMFNQMFWTDLDKATIDRIMSVMWWTTLKNIYTQTIGRFLKTLSKSSTINRMLLSYPWQLATIWYQTIWYTTRETALTKALWSSNKDLGKSGRIRKELWILEWQYFEIGWDSLTEKFYLADDDTFTEMYKISWINYWDDSATVIRKLQNMMTTTDWRRLLDNTKDNANNLIDWFFARTMKDLSFMSALQNNSARKFINVDELYMYLKNNNIPKERKDQVLRELNLASARSFNNIMWLGSNWPMALKPSWAFGEFCLDVYNLFNFRWQWGTTILRQFTTRVLEVFKAWWYFMKNIWKPWIWDEIMDYFSRNIEFRNFVNSMIWDMYLATKVAREYDRNRENDDWWDTVEDVLHAINFTSMYLQGISSSWLGRVWSSAINQIFFGVWQWHSLEDIIGETAMAIVKTMFQNFGRNFKVYDYETKCFRAWQEWGWDGLWQYVGNTFFNLSLWALNYISDDVAYWNYNNNFSFYWPRSMIVWEAHNEDNEFLSLRDNYQDYLLSKPSNKEDVVVWEEWTFSRFDSVFSLSKMFDTWKQIKIAVEQQSRKHSKEVEDQIAYEKNKLNVRQFSELSDAMSDSKVMKEITTSWMFTLETTKDYDKMMNGFSNPNQAWWSYYESNVNNWLNWAESKITYEQDKEDFEWLMNKLGRDNIAKMMDEFHTMTNQKGVDSLEKRAWLSKYTLNLIYDNLQDDPEFLYAYQLRAKGGIQLMYDAELDKAYNNDSYNKKSNPNWLWYWTKESWKSAYENEFKKQFVNANVRDWAELDYQTYLNKGWEKMIQDEPEKFKWFVNYYEKDWEIKATLKPSYKKMAENQLWAIKHFEEWKPLEALADTSLLVKQVDYVDESWITALALMQDTFEYIDKSSYPETLKAYMKAKLWVENIGIIKRVEWYVNQLGKDSWVVDMAYDVLYNANDSLTDAIKQVAQSLEVWNKQSKWTWKHWSSLAKLKAVKIELDKLAWWDYRKGNWSKRPKVNYPVYKIMWSELLREVNKVKKKSKPNNNLEINKYTEVPLLTQPKTAAPKKLKWVKKKVKNK